MQTCSYANDLKAYFDGGGVGGLLSGLVIIVMLKTEAVYR